MNITIKINTGNAAFGDNPYPELARILREIAAAYDREHYPRMITDANGNTCGTIRAAPAFSVFEPSRSPEIRSPAGRLAHAAGRLGRLHHPHGATQKRNLTDPLAF